MKFATDQPDVFKRYEGQFTGGKMYGYGIYYFANGNRYEGRALLIGMHQSAAPLQLPHSML